MEKEPKSKSWWSERCFVSRDFRRAGGPWLDVDVLPAQVNGGAGRRLRVAQVQDLPHDFRERLVGAVVGHTRAADAPAAGSGVLTIHRRM